MKVIAPLVILFVAVGALYKTKEIWAKDDYDAAWGSDAWKAVGPAAASGGGV